KAGLESGARFALSTLHQHFDQRPQKDEPENEEHQKDEGRERVEQDDLIGTRKGNEIQFERLLNEDDNSQYQEDPTGDIYLFIVGLPRVGLHGGRWPLIVTFFFRIGCPGLKNIEDLGAYRDAEF